MFRCSEEPEYKNISEQKASSKDFFIIILEGFPNMHFTLPDDISDISSRYFTCVVYCHMHMCLKYEIYLLSKDISKL